jgi:hypothetical protein
MKVIIREGDRPRAARTSPITNPREPNPSVTTELPREYHDKLEQLCKSLGTNKSAFVRKLIIERLDENGWVRR